MKEYEREKRGEEEGVDNESGVTRSWLLLAVPMTAGGHHGGWFTVTTGPECAKGNMLGCGESRKLIEFDAGADVMGRAVDCVEVQLRSVLRTVRDNI